MSVLNISSVAQSVGRFSGETSVQVSLPADLPHAAPVIQAAIKEVVQQPTAPQLQNAVDNINRKLSQSNKSMEFSVDARTKTFVVRLTDTDTGQLIRQYPAEEVLAIAQSIDEYLSQHQLQQGMLIKQKA